MPRFDRRVQVGSVLDESVRRDLTDEERDQFASQAGKMAHDVMSRYVNGARWETTPDIIKRRIFNRVFSESRSRARAGLVGPEETQTAVREIMEAEGLR
jgi:hypothetical protein